MVLIHDIMTLVQYLDNFLSFHTKLTMVIHISNEDVQCTATPPPELRGLGKDLLKQHYKG